MIETIFYYILLTGWGILFAISVARYVFRRAPGGDASVDWAWGLLYTAGLGGVLLVAVVLWHTPGYRVALLLLPLFVILLPALKNSLRCLYVWWPVGVKTPDLTIRIKNRTPAHIRVIVECWFGAGNSGTARLYTTYPFRIGPNTTETFDLTDDPTRIIAHKTRFVTIQVFEIIGNIHEGQFYEIEMQPCMQYRKEAPEVFRSGLFELVIEEGRNTDMFRAEVERRKAANMYGSGVF